MGRFEAGKRGLLALGGAALIAGAIWGARLALPYVAPTWQLERAARRFDGCLRRVDLPCLRAMIDEEELEVSGLGDDGLERFVRAEILPRLGDGPVSGSSCCENGYGETFAWRFDRAVSGRYEASVVLDDGPHIRGFFNGLIWGETDGAAPYPVRTRQTIRALREAGSRWRVYGFQRFLGEKAPGMHAASNERALARWTARARTRPANAP